MSYRGVSVLLPEPLHNRIHRLQWKIHIYNTQKLTKINIIRKNIYVPNKTKSNNKTTTFALSALSQEPSISHINILANTKDNGPIEKGSRSRNYANVPVDDVLVRAGVITLIIESAQWECRYTWARMERIEKDKKRRVRRS